MNKCPHIDIYFPLSESFDSTLASFNCLAPLLSKCTVVYGNDTEEE